MKTITIYELIQKLTKFNGNYKVTIKNDSLYILNPEETVDNEDIEEYENYINSVENQDSIY